VDLPKNIRAFVPGDPKDDAIVQTAISSIADYLVTVDALLLQLSKVRDVEIISTKTFAERLPALQ
jgi:predicted nucleic acid-binding protein